MAARDDIMKELKVKLDMLVKSYHTLERYREKAQQLEAENAELQKKYEELLNASAFSVNDETSKAAKNYISHIIREIDKCISLLSA